MKIQAVILIFIFSVLSLKAQLSPGDLSNLHTHLEGISNCTQCHVLGNKVSNDKCLICHTEIQSRIILQKGYHSSSDVKGKQCSACHSEHNGKNFQLIRLDTIKFDHNLSGYSLSLPHSKKKCTDCHIGKFITDQKIKSKKSTYLGLTSDCLNCHTDYHRKTLSSACTDCHNPDSFKTAPVFTHDKAKFRLVGKHLNVDCIKCHKVQMIDGNKFQEFRGVEFANCTNCHKDPHQNKFGQNCRQCHSEESFLVVSGGAKFDHDKTDFKLEEKHLSVSCKACHKTKLTDPLKHENCTDCHADYHNNQFVKNGVSPDCSQCHTVKGFTYFTYTSQQHDMGKFPLLGSHTAVPCFECHKKEDKWNFKAIGLDCKDCHTDIHKTFIQAKYYPEENCKVCHNESRWTDITFNHSGTEFKLTGAHNKQGCRSCHFRQDSIGTPVQKFAGLSVTCTTCHVDNHNRQFEKDGATDCLRCHTTENWKASGFDHNNFAFKLDGKHKNVECSKCHKPQQIGTSVVINYKINDFKCESCHS
jgi:hypothetical protein